MSDALRGEMIVKIGSMHGQIVAIVRGCVEGVGMGEKARSSLTKAPIFCTIHTNHILHLY